MEKILTISIAAYNAEKYLVRCLSSFISSDILSMLEILVIDDGSQDTTAQITKKIEKQYPESIRLIHKKNGGHGSTINTGIKNATGKYFKTVDADDWVDQTGIRYLLNFLSKNDVDLILNPYNKVNEYGNIIEDVPCVKSSMVEYGRIYQIEDIAQILIIAMHAFTFKTQILKNMNREIDEHCFYVDAEYTIFPLPLVHTVTVLDFPVYLYLSGINEQSMNIQNMIKRREEHLRVIRRVIEFYNEKIGNIRDELGQLIYERIIEIIKIQYIIYFSMNDLTQSKKEILKFECEIHEANNVLYIGVLSQKNYYSMKLLKILRIIKFNGYKEIIRILQLLKLL